MVTPWQFRGNSVVIPWSFRSSFRGNSIVVSWLFQRYPATAFTATIALAAAQGPRPLAITFVANAGIILSAEGTSVIIDGLFGDGLPDYGRLEPATRELAESGRGRFGEVSLILATHWHDDHFNPQAVGRHLASNPRAQFVSSSQVIARLESEFEAFAALRDRVHAVTPEPGASAVWIGDDVTVTVLRLRHNPSRRFPDEHLAFIVELGGRRVLHVGDADPVPDNFDGVERFPHAIDFAIVPYWYGTDETARAILAGQVYAPQVLAIHVEPERAAQVRAAVHAARPGTLVLTQSMQTLRF